MSRKIASIKKFTWHHLLLTVTLGVVPEFSQIYVLYFPLYIYVFKATGF